MCARDVRSTDRLLKDFDRTVRSVRDVFVTRFDEDFAAIMAIEARAQYAALIPQVPDIGGKQPFTQFLTSTAWFLAMYRVLQRHGFGVEDTGRLVYQVSKVYLKRSPSFARGVLGFMTFSRHYLRRLQQRAEESRQHRYPGDYVYLFVPGDGQPFDYGVDYIECAALKFLQQQGAPELAPYLCASDKVYSEMLGWGLVRTVTLAEGADRCDFRFRRGGPTRVALPDALREVDVA